MKRRISFLLTLCMILSFCAFGAAPAMAGDWKLPEGTPMYKPGCVMETEFGTFTVLDVGFAKKVELFYSVNTQTITRNGVSETKENRNEFYFTAKDGSAFFVVKGILQNTSASTYNTRELHPLIQYGTGGTVSMDAFPSAPLTGSVAPPPGVEIVLDSGESVEVSFACTFSEESYRENADILFTFGGASLGFRKEELKSYVSMGFGDGDGVPTDDVTALVKETIPAAGQQAEPEEPHVDELAVEDVAFEYDSKNQRYRMNVKVRNIQYPTFEGLGIKSVRVGFQFLDKNGDAVAVNRSEIPGYEDLRTGQAGWGPYVLTGSGSIYPIDRVTVDTAYSITFTTYEVISTNDAEGRSKRIKGTLSDPPVFILDDIIPGRSDAEAMAGSDAVMVENVSVDFTDKLPAEITGSTAYRAGIQKDFHYTLTDSETYAVIRFSITNMTTKEIELAETGGDFFFVELNFNNGFLYSTKGSKACVMTSGKEIAVMESSGSGSTRIGNAIAIGPLVTYDVTLYLPCAKLVETMTDKPLVVSFHTTQTGDKQIDVKVR